MKQTQNIKFIGVTLGGLAVIASAWAVIKK
jgi:hypothetical protein